LDTSYSGGCACGAIRFEISAVPLFQNHCQCLDCQHSSGTGHSSYLTFPREGVRQTGRATLWSMVGDSGRVKTRAFCPVCGSPVYMTFSALPELFTVHATSLDDPGRFRPQVVTYASRGHAWDHFDPGLPRFDTMPPS
jgi:hypothetical protein